MSQPSHLPSAMIKHHYCTQWEIRIPQLLKKVMPNFGDSTGANVSTSKIFLCTSSLPAQRKEVNAAFQTSLVRDETGRDTQPEMITVQVPGRPYEQWTSDEEPPLIPAVPAGGRTGLGCHHATTAPHCPGRDEPKWKKTHTTFLQSRRRTLICFHTPLGQL